MKSLDGRELAGYIKQRHAGQVRRLKGAKIQPKLAILQIKDDPVIDTYVRLKKQYGADIGVEVDIHRPTQRAALELIGQLNTDESVHGIIVQLPLPDPRRTEEVINKVSPAKDVDALGARAGFQPATPMAILWLLAGYNISLAGKKVLIIGRGKLVGTPLERILKDSEVSTQTATRDTIKSDLAAMAEEADIIITGANEPGVLTSDMVKSGAVVVDAGVAEEQGKTVGNVEPKLYEREDIVITPQKGGVGPLTVCALFENLLIAAGKTAGKD